MKPIFTILILAVSFHAHSQDLSKCRTNNWNPYYYFDISKDINGHLTGKLDHAVSGWAGENRKNLGTDMLQLRLNPSTCSLHILSKNHNQKEFVIRMSLMTFPDQKNFSGEFKGSMFEDQPISCDISQSPILNEIKEICQKHNSIDQELVFSNAKQLESLSLLSTAGIHNIIGLEVSKSLDYPVFNYTPPKGEIYNNKVNRDN